MFLDNKTLETVVYDFKVKEYPERFYPVLERLALHPTDRLKVYGSLRIIADNIFRDEKGKVDKEYLAQLKKKFMECCDPTEYYFAVKCFKSYDFYLRVKADSKIFRTEVEKWKRELEVKLRARALRDLINKGKSSSNAAEYIFSGKYKEHFEEYKKLSKQEKEEQEKKVIYSVFSDAEEELEELLEERKKADNNAS